jgi:hypothetical protein
LNITSGNNVGIGTSNPGAKLDVAGVIQLDIGATITNGFALCHVTDGASANQDIRDCEGTITADYMEMYATPEDVEAGDLMAAGDTYVTTTQGDRVVKLKKSTQAYQASIIGIASDLDGAGDFNSIGHNIAEDDHPYPIALSGRVKVKVTAENGSIAIGDFIAASSTAGKGMRATEAGMVIGQALEAWDPNSGTDRVMVFVKNLYYMPEDEQLGNDFQINDGPSGYQLQNMTIGDSVDELGAFDTAYIANLTAGKIDASEIVLSGVDLSSSIEGLNLQLQGVETALSFMDELPLWKDSMENRLVAIENQDEYATKAELAATQESTEQGIFDLETKVNDTVARLDTLERESTTSAELVSLTNRVSFIEQMLFGHEASNSAELASLIDPSENPEGEVLGIVDGKLNLEDLTVTGKTNLFDLGVVGEITAGQLIIDGKEGKINTLATPLDIQSDGLADVQIMAGKVIIDTQGNIQVKGEVTAEKYNVEVSNEDKASIGEGMIELGTTEVTIRTEAITDDSKVFVTSHVALDVPLAVINKKKGQSFTVRLKYAQNQDVKFDWWIVN